MTEWDQVLQATDGAVAASEDDELLVVTSATGPVLAIELAQEWFGEDDDRSALRLVVDGIDRGVLRRTAAYALVGSSDRGTLGAGDHATLPGHSVEYVVLRLHCPHEGCQVSGLALSYDPDDPPTCSVHHVALLVAA
ncbi:hypothetical protein [Angustibacter luteus]|uniref:Rieske domain-containing protein n=1 Tax=Angustibacter luteus TaxID=658456 RepID=A0ABW1JC24_9ACTN